MATRFREEQFADHPDERRAQKGRAPQLSRRPADELICHSEAGLPSARPPSRYRQQVDRNKCAVELTMVLSLSPGRHSGDQNSIRAPTCPVRLPPKSAGRAEVICPTLELSIAST